jgi:hypothetical protein
MSLLNYDRKIAQKLKNIDKKYVEAEDKKELVGGNVRELVDIKEGMGLEGMGLSAGMKKVLRKTTKGKGMSAGAQLGYDGPPVFKDNTVPPFFRAGGMSAGRMCACGMSAGRMCACGMSAGRYEEGSGLTACGMSAGGMSAGGFLDLIKIPLSLMGLGKDGKCCCEMEGSGKVVETIKKFMNEIHPLVMEKPKKGKGMSAGASMNMEVVLPGPKNDGRTGNQALMGYGVDIFDIIGKDTPKKGKGMGKRPTKENMHSSSFSGGAKKLNKRAEIVKKVMRERGVKMIEASKIVKNEGLY